MNFSKLSSLEKILIVGLSVTAIILIYVAFVKPSAISMEILKTGGKDNFKLVETLYKSDSYKEQQKTAIEQALGTVTQ